MASESGIYEILNTVNGKRYIGSAVRLWNRKRQHLQSLGRGDHHAIALQRAWRMYGADAFEFRTVLLCSKENLIMYEQICMDALKPEYNSAPKAGSRLGLKHSDEVRAKMSASRPKDFSPMKGKTHSAETKAKISASRKGKGGGVMSQERKDKIGAAHKGRIITPEQRAKISAALTGHKQSAEQIEKRMLKLRGRKMPEGFAEAARIRMTGRKVSDETRIKNARARAKLTDDQVREVRSRRAMGEKQKDLAAAFAINQASISEILARKSYAWVL